MTNSTLLDTRDIDGLRGGIRHHRCRSPRPRPRPPASRARSRSTWDHGSTRPSRTSGRVQVTPPGSTWSGSTSCAGAGSSSTPSGSGRPLVEIVGGDRPVSQVLRWTTPEVYQDLARRAHLVARTAGRAPGAGEVQQVRPQLVAAHTSFVSERCAEVSLHVRYGERSRAVAARFELIRDRWQVSALEFA